MNLEVFKYLFNWKSILEIIILWICIYGILSFLKGTKAVYLLRGILLISALLFISQIFGLPILTRLLTYFFGFFLIFSVIIFQPELRDGLSKLGRRHFLFFDHKKEDIKKALKEIVSGVESLSKKQNGALVVIKREVGLKNFIESGIVLNADLSKELLETIFSYNSPIHDGGVIVDGLKILAAACIFPLSDNPNLPKTLGTRHRAAIGISEHTDAIAIVVSEEDGKISLAINGKLTSTLSPDELFTILNGQFIR